MIHTVATRQTPRPAALQPQRIGDRRKVRVPGRLTWRDASGTLRFVSVVTRDVSDVDAFVECQMPASIPLYRLVHFQVERPARGRRDLPAVLQQGKVLSAVYRVGPYSPRRARRRATRCACWSSRSATPPRSGREPLGGRELEAAIQPTRNWQGRAACCLGVGVGTCSRSTCFRQYRASPSQSSSNGAATRYAATCASVIVRAQFAPKLLGKPRRPLLVGARLAPATSRRRSRACVAGSPAAPAGAAGRGDRTEVREEQRLPATTPRFAPRCPATARCRCPAAASAAARSRRRSQTPAVSPTNATPLDAIEVADVMRRVARRVRDLERAAAGLDALAAGAASTRFCAGTGATSPHSRPSVAVEARRAVEQLRGIDHVAARRARARDTRDVRVPPHDACRWRPRDRGGCASAGCGDVAEPDRLPLQAELERLETGRRPGIDERHAARRADDAVAIACGRPRNCRSIHEKPDASNGKVMSRKGLY